MQRTTYFIRRLLLAIPTFLGITILCFTLTQLIPGGPVDRLLMKMQSIGSGEFGAGQAIAGQISPEYRKQLEKHFGFDRPIYERYYHWLVIDRLGMRMDSYKYPNKTAWEIISDRFPVSLVFGITGFALSYLICIPLGISKAIHHGTKFDFLTSMLIFAGYALPPFACGMALKTFLCGTNESFFDVFPFSGFVSDNFDQISFGAKIFDLIQHMTLPVTCYLVGNFALLTVLMKNSLLEQISKEYVYAVLARGGSPTMAIWGHALRNALIPIVTGLGSILTVMFAGSIVIEQVFEIPGMGLLSLEAIIGRDYAVFMGILALTSLLTLIGNIISDFCYLLIDPRIDFR